MKIILKGPGIFTVNVLTIYPVVVGISELNVTQNVRQTDLPLTRLTLPFLGHIANLSLPLNSFGPKYCMKYSYSLYYSM